MRAGRPQIVDPGTLYAFAHQFYWDLRRIAEGHTRFRFDRKRYTKREARIKRLHFQVTDDQKSQIAELVDEEIRVGRLNPAERVSRIRNVEESQTSANQEWMLQRSADACRIELRVPGEPDVITDLIAAETPE